MNNIKVIKTNKYKNINLYLRYTFKYNECVSLCAYLLCKIIGNITEKYNCKQKMSRTKDMLYNIGLDVGIKPRKDYLTLAIHYSFLNPKFVSIDIKEYCDYIDQTLNHSIVNADTLTEAKRSIVSNYLRDLDKPSNFSIEKVLKQISKDEPGFKAVCKPDDFVNKINNITVEQVLKAYKDIINKARLDLYLCGDVCKKDIKLLTNYNFENRSKYTLNKSHIKFNTRKTITCKKDISQSNVYCLYATPYSRYHKDYFAWMMANCILGSCPSSLLFQEVREKLSLCYSINSSLIKSEGLVMVSTSIDGKNKSKTINQINKQIDRLINKDYDSRIIQICRNYMIDAFKSSKDDIESMVDLLFMNKLNGLDYSIDYICNQLKKINENDIARVCKNFRPYFNFVLIGTKHE